MDLNNISTLSTTVVKRSDGETIVLKENGIRYGVAYRDEKQKCFWVTIDVDGLDFFVPFGSSHAEGLGLLA